jgi:phosphoribosylamine--glycine ligase
VAGLADRLRGAGIATFGPGAAAARASRAARPGPSSSSRATGIPTARLRGRHDAAAAERGARDARAARAWSRPTASCAGKGVTVVAKDTRGARAAARAMLDGPFGAAGAAAGDRAAICAGARCRLLALTDGERGSRCWRRPRITRRSSDGDVGPNTGGMGTVSARVDLADDARGAVHCGRSSSPTLRGLASEGIDYRGVLYAGLMVDARTARRGPHRVQLPLRRSRDPAADARGSAATCWRGAAWARRTARLPADAIRWARATRRACRGGRSRRLPRRRPRTGDRDRPGLDGGVSTASPTCRCSTPVRTAIGAARWSPAGGRVLGVTALGADVERRADGAPTPRPIAIGLAGQAAAAPTSAAAPDHHAGPSRRGVTPGASPAPRAGAPPRRRRTPPARPATGADRTAARRPASRTRPARRAPADSRRCRC